MCGLGDVLMQVEESQGDVARYEQLLSALALLARRTPDNVIRVTLNWREEMRRYVQFFKAIYYRYECPSDNTKSRK
jgi:histidinol-phosphate/aromatic aminotransferase/cobyric acid decarboxylase-like protein